MLVSHPEGAACILKARGMEQASSDFEDELLQMLRGPVVNAPVFLLWVCG